MEEKNIIETNERGGRGALEGLSVCVRVCIKIIQLFFTSYGK